MPVVDAVRDGGNTTAGLGCQVPLAPEIVVKVVTLFEPELTTPRTVRLPVPEARRRKNRIDGVAEFTHIHGLRAVPPPGTCTECVPKEPSSEFESPPTILAPFPHDQPLAPLSKLAPGNGVYAP